MWDKISNAWWIASLSILIWDALQSNDFWPQLTLCVCVCVGRRESTKCFASCLFTCMIPHVCLCMWNRFECVGAIYPNHHLALSSLIKCAFVIWVDGRMTVQVWSMMRFTARKSNGIRPAKSVSTSPSASLSTFQFIYIPFWHKVYWITYLIYMQMNSFWA